jgi:HSP20 family protein
MLTKLTPATPQRGALTAYEVLRGEMDRLFNDWLGEFGSPMLPNGEKGFFAPRIDVKESDKEFVMTAELAGMDAKDVEVELDRGMLLIKGRKQQEHEEKNDTFYSRERRFGSFERRIQLPWEVDAAVKPEASFKNGVLTVTVPRPKEAVSGRKKIAIKAV